MPAGGGQARTERARQPASSPGPPLSPLARPPLGKFPSRTWDPPSWRLPSPTRQSLSPSTRADPDPTPHLFQNSFLRLLLQKSTFMKKPGSVYRPVRTSLPDQSLPGLTCTLVRLSGKARLPQKLQDPRNLQHTGLQALNPRAAEKEASNGQTQRAITL